MKYLTFFGLLLGCLSAHGGYNSNATVTSIAFDADYPNVILINVSGVKKNPLACHQVEYADYFIDASTERGAQMYAAILMLKASNKAANFGAWSCDGSRYNDIGKLNNLKLLP